MCAVGAVGEVDVVVVNIVGVVWVISGGKKKKSRQTDTHTKTHTQTLTHTLTLSHAHTLTHWLQEGRVHSLSWHPSGRKFIVVHGNMPSKTVLYNHKCEAKFDFGTLHRNEARRRRRCCCRWCGCCQCHGLISASVIIGGKGIRSDIEALCSLEGV